MFLRQPLSGGVLRLIGMGVERPVTGLGVARGKCGTWGEEGKGATARTISKMCSYCKRSEGYISLAASGQRLEDTNRA